MDFSEYPDEVLFMMLRLDEEVGAQFAGLLYGSPTTKTRRAHAIAQSAMAQQRDAINRELLSRYKTPERVDEARILALLRA